ncbi:MAG: biotin--[acetyl-CoA-carboxylase] ligase [Acidobacteriota bacterium]
MSFAKHSRELEARWKGRRGRGLVICGQVGSTHHLGRRLAREYISEGGSPPPADIFAWEQSESVGRHGRSWSSPRGAGVYATLVRPLDEAPLQLLPLQVAVSLCQTLNGLLDDRCRLKWPNDLVCNSRKLGGILIDSFSRGDGPPVAVISFGVNHSRDLDALGEPAATSLLAEGSPPVGLAELTDRLVADLDRRLSDTDGDVVPTYRDLSAHRPGEALVCRHGDETICGRFRGIDPQGFLLLEVEGEERRLAAGDIESHG